MKKTAAIGFVLLSLLALTSCAPVVYEVGISPDIYAQLENQAFFQNLPEASGYTEARVLYSEKDYSIIVLNDSITGTTVSAPKNPFSRFISMFSGEKTFRLAGIAIAPSGQQPVKDGGFSAAKPFGSSAFDDREVEISRRYVYPCVPFAEDPVFTAYAPLTAGSGRNASVSDCSFYELDEIPSGMVMLPVQLGDVLYLAGDEDYPLYESTFVRIQKNKMPDQEKEEPSADRAVIRTAEDAMNAIEQQENSVKYTAALNRFYDEAILRVDEFFRTDTVAALKETPSLPAVFFIASAGDMMMSRGADWAMINADSPSPVFTDTIPILKKNSITIGNLEGPVTTSSAPIDKTFVFKYRPEVLEYLRQAGFNYLKLNNTHIWDYGEIGFLDTLDALADAGFATSGAGRNDEQASLFYRTNCNGCAVSILSVAAAQLDPYYTNRKLSAATETKSGILWETDRLFDLIRDEKRSSKIVIINVHGGTEYTENPSQDQQILYRRLCDAGADIVFGSHPHVLQPVEWYNDSMIVWSLGNFMYPGMEDIAGTETSMIVRTGFVNGRLLYFEKYPTVNVGTKVSLNK